MKKSLIVLAVFSLSACSVSQDPADGGFLSGLVGVGGGGYQDRVDEGQAALEEDQAQAAVLQAQQQRAYARSAAMATEIEQLRAKHTQWRVTISNQVAELRSSGAVMSPFIMARVNAVVNTSPSGSNDAARLAALQTAIADARALSADLAALS
ncbi:MAG: hypothetical protein JKY31_01460 [Rhodobacteraceae bacterium]|nr:hypothetical protein [Paracoccaceae bacterium]